MIVTKKIEPQGFQPVTLTLRFETEEEYNALQVLVESPFLLALYVAAGMDGEPDDSSALNPSEKQLYDKLVILLNSLYDNL